ncbi:MAG: 16S rRNA (cytosine(967)-C(5))-methyltransferase RsmB [Actinomycetes bacterium]
MSDGTSDEGLAARRAALRALTDVDERDAWATEVVPRAVADLPDERDRAFASHLAYDTVRWRGSLDWLLDQVLARPLEKVEAPLQRVLRLGALQLWRTDVPAHAAVSTSVALARETVPAARAAGAGGFVNGVLRGLGRLLAADIPWPDDELDALALTTGHPRWIVEELHARYGTERTRTILEADDENPGLTLRAAGDRDALVAELRDAGLAATAGAHAPEAVRVPGADPRALAAVAEGRATPQDEASMLVVHAAGAGEGERVLDLCAAPGGKTTHLATLVGPDGHVVAVELHASRARRVAGAAARLGLRNVEVRVGDALVPAPDGPVAVDETFDVVLVDAPCTGLGTGRRRPEVRWRRRPEDVDALAALQRDLLEVALGRVRAGGRLTYAVCTWTHGETDGVVDAFEAAHPELEPLGRRQLLPDADGTDGMFHATWWVPG